MRAKHWASIAFSVVFAASPVLAVDRTWGGGSNGALPSGSFNWNVPGNWSGDNVPNGFDVAEVAVIGDATGNRNITMNVAGGISSYVQMTQSSEFQNKLTLSDDIRTGSSGTTSFTNTSSSNGNLVVDLNGKLLSMFSLPSLGSAKMQVLSTTAGGRFRLEGGMSSTPTSSDMYLGSGTTMVVEFGNIRLGSVEWSPSSNLLVSNRFGNALINHFNANNTVIGNWQIGEIGGFQAVVDMIGGDRTVQGDVLITKPGDKLRWAVNARLAVKGNFTDNNTDVYRTNSGDPFSASGTAVDPVGSDTLMFYGSPSTPSIVNIAHGMAGVDLLIGDSGAAGGNHDGSDSSGNIRMSSDLTTSGSATVRAGSTVDLTGKKLTSGTFLGESTITLGYAVGSVSGLINVTGNTTLNTFNLVLANNGGWVSGSNLLLMQYGGTLSGTPALGTVTYPYPGGSSGGLLIDTTNKQIFLTNVVLPEPAGALALAGGIAMIIDRRRRRFARAA